VCLSDGRLARYRQLLGGRRRSANRWLRGCRRLLRWRQLFCRRLGLRRRWLRRRELLGRRLRLGRRLLSRWWCSLRCGRRRRSGWRWRLWLSLGWVRSLRRRAGLLCTRRRALICGRRWSARCMLRGLPGSRATRTLLRRPRGPRSRLLLSRLFLLTRIRLSRRTGRRRLCDDNGPIRRARLCGDRQG
jgi:hypothetical protein